MAVAEVLQRGNCKHCESGLPRSSDIPQRPLLSGPLSLVLHPPPPATGRRVLGPRVSGTSYRAPVLSPRFVTTTMMTKVVMSK